MSARPVLAPDAAIALGIASTAMPFARTRVDEVERWLRVLRLHGRVGIELQALGVTEEPLPDRRRDVERNREDVRVDGDRGGGGDGGDRAPGGDRDAGGGRDAAGDPNGAFTGGDDRDAVALVTEHAVRVAAERGARALATTDILVAVMCVYGEDFDRALEVHGGDRYEILERLGIGAATL